MRILFNAILAATILAASGCGGGEGGGQAGGTTPPPAGTGGTTPPPAARSIGGLWSGALRWPASAPSPAGSTTARILVAETGEFRIVMTTDPDWWPDALFSNESEQIYGTFGYSGGHVVTTGDAVAIMPLGAGNTTGDNFGDFAMSGRFDSPTIFSGTFQSGYTTFLERVGTIGFTYHSLYEQPSSLALLRGTFTTSNTSLSIDSQGAIFFQSAANGCTGNGQAEIIDARYNMYRLSVTVGNCTGIDAARNGNTFTGLANIGVNNDLTGAFINETLELALSVAVDGGHYIGWNHLAHRR